MDGDVGVFCDHCSQLPEGSGPAPKIQCSQCKRQMCHTLLLWIRVKEFWTPRASEERLCRACYYSGESVVRECGETDDKTIPED